MYQDDSHSVENIDFIVEVSNMQVHNSIIDCSIYSLQLVQGLVSLI